MSEVSRKGTVLVVEDENLLRKAFRELLEFEGFRVLTARDGRSALDLLTSTDDVTLILLDFQMPVMDGIEFRKHQLDNPRIASIPVIGLTGGPNSDSDAARLQISTVLRKPITLDRLVAALEQRSTKPEGGGRSAPATTAAEGKSRPNVTFPR